MIQKLEIALNVLTLFEIFLGLGLVCIYLDHVKVSKPFSYPAKVLSQTGADRFFRFLQLW